MEADGLLDVLVPVAPLVRAGKLLVLVRYPQLLQMRVKIAVVLQEKVFRADVDSELWRAVLIDLLRQRKGIVRPADGIFPSDSAELYCHRLIALERLVRPGESSGMAVGGGEELRI